MKLLLTYKNFQKPGVSHIGLGVSALNTAKVLIAHGIPVIVQAVNSTKDIANLIDKHPDVTHVVVSAPWIKVTDLTLLICQYCNVQFAVNCHSNVGFLQADTAGVQLIRQYIDTEQGNLNFRVSANSTKGTRWLREAYQAPCLYLPNLYYLDYSRAHSRPVWNGGILRIGAFGATRPLKNLMSAAGAALVIKNSLKAETEFWLSSGRPDGGAGVVQSIQAMLQGVPGMRLMFNQWASWPQFRDTVREMHLLLNVSYTESFNMVTADGVAEGVPSVVSDAIDWAPENWVARTDDALTISHRGMCLIRDPNAGHDGFVALEQHNKDGFGAWGQWLNVFLPYKSLLNDPFLI